ncbi:MAG: nitroreductase [Burkholderiaceae bacterium]
MSQTQSTMRQLAADAPPDAAEVLGTLLAQRFSCRAFRPQPVPNKTVEHILRQAQRTASWCNSQAWQVAVTRGEGTERLRQRLLAHVDSKPADSNDLPFPEAYLGVYLQRRRESGFQLYDALGIGRGDREAYARQVRENFAFFGAPHVAVISSNRSLGVYGAIDCGAYVSNFLLAARACGVATLPQAALARHGGFLRKELGLAEDRLVVCGISFGYADEGHPANSYRTSRAGLDEVVQWVD